MFKCAPSFTTEGIWDFLGNRGVYSDSASVLRSAFDYLEHNNGVLIYKLKPEEEIKNLAAEPTEDESKNIFFENIAFSDPCGNIVTHDDADGKFTVLFTHNDEDHELVDYIETYGIYATSAEMTCVPPEILALFPDLP